MKNISKAMRDDQPTKKTILIITLSLSEKNGLGRYSLSVVNELRKYYNLVIFTGEEDIIKLENCVVYPILPSLHVFLKMRNPLVMAKLVWKVYCRAGKVDFVHSLMDYPHSLLAFIIGGLLRRPLFLTTHGTYSLKPFNWRIDKWLHKFILRNASAIFSISNFTKAEILKRVNLSNIIVVNNGIDICRFGNLSSPIFSDDNIRLLGVGALKMRKGFHVTIKAVAMIREKYPKIIYTIIGDQSDTEYYSYLKQLIVDYKLEDNVIFLHSLTDSELFNQYNLSDVFILTPVNVDDAFEGFGLVYLEAGAFCKPVIGSSGCGAEDAIVDGETGILVSQNDPEEISKAIIKLLDNQELAKKMGESGRHRSMVMSWGAQVEKYRSKYEEFMEPQKKITEKIKNYYLKLKQDGLESNQPESKKNNKKKNLLFSIFAVFIFFAATVFWYSPIMFKGYSVDSIGEGVIMARNYVKSGVLGMESDLNVVVSSELAGKSVHRSPLSNELDPVSYIAVYKIFGWQDWNHLILIPIVIYALSLIIFTIVVYYLFGFSVAAIFSLIFILLPFNGQMARSVSFYEFAQLYFSIFCLLFFVGRDRKNKHIYFLSAGFFLSLACLAREAFFIFLPILFIWLVIWEKKRELLAVFVPVGLVLSVFWLPAILGFGGGNAYSGLFVEQNQNQWSEFGSYGHVYPDPYSFHFDKQRTINQLNNEVNANQSSLLYKIDRLKVGKNTGIKDVGLIERFVVGTSNLVAQVSKYFAIEFIGGPIVSLLIFIGLFELARRKRNLFYLFVLWLIGAPLLISYIVLANRNHLMDFAWPLAILSALGTVALIRIVIDYFGCKKYAKLISLFVLFVIVYSLVLANHVYLGRSYDDNTNLALSYFATKINERNIGPTEVIAVGVRTAHPILNYLTDKSVVYFDPATIARLAEANDLQQAFDKFNVKYAIGFDDATADLIAKKSHVEMIAAWPNDDFLLMPVSFNKMWLLNIIK